MFLLFSYLIFLFLLYINLFLLKIVFYICIKFRTHRSDLEWFQKLGVPIPQKVYDSQFNQKYVSNINYIKTIPYICIIIIMINQKVIDLATSFLLNRSESDDKLNNSSKEELIKLVNDLLYSINSKT
jgi:hypothetical protein